MSAARTMHKSHKPLTGKGATIINAVMDKHMIGVKDFFGTSRLTHLVDARRIAIRLLKDAGFNDAAIARLMKRNYSTVRYWLKPEYRSRQMAYSLAYWHRQEIAA